MGLVPKVLYENGLRQLCMLLMYTRRYDHSPPLYVRPSSNAA